MELILIVLTSSIISCLMMGSFYLGYRYRDEKKGESEEGIHFNKNNKDFLVEMAKWANYNGKEQ